MNTGSTLYLPHVIDVLDEYGEAVRTLYKEKLIDHNKQASGALINTLTYGINAGPNHYAVYLNVQDYFRYVESGRKPGKFPPPPAIKRWIEIKPVTPDPIAVKLKSGTKYVTPTTDQLAFLIGRKIAREGIAPQPLLAETLEELNAIYERKLDEAIEKDLDEIAAAIVIRSFPK